MRYSHRRCRRPERRRLRLVMSLLRRGKLGVTALETPKGRLVVHVQLAGGRGSTAQDCPNEQRPLCVHGFCGVRMRDRRGWTRF